MDSFVKIPVKTWFLKFPKNKTIPPPEKGIKVKEWKMPDVTDYLIMYKNIGETYGWSNRLLMEKKQLISLLHKNSIFFFLYYVDGLKAGYFEIDFSSPKKAEIVYLGLAPKYVGKGHGKSIMFEAIRKASNHGKNLVWLHTCEHDNKRALQTYLKAGFKIIKEEIMEDYYPKNHPAIKNKQ